MGSLNNASENERFWSVSPCFGFGRHNLQMASTELFRAFKVGQFHAVERITKTLDLSMTAPQWYPPLWLLSKPLRSESYWTVLACAPWLCNNRLGKWLNCTEPRRGLDAALCLLFWGARRYTSPVSVDLVKGVPQIVVNRWAMYNDSWAALFGHAILSRSYLLQGIQDIYCNCLVFVYRHYSSTRTRRLQV